MTLSKILGRSALREDVETHCTGDVNQTIRPWLVTGCVGSGSVGTCGVTATSLCSMSLSGFICCKGCATVTRLRFPVLPPTWLGTRLSQLRAVDLVLARLLTLWHPAHQGSV